MGKMAIAVRCYKELAGYAYPKLRHVEYDAQVSGTVKFEIITGIEDAPGDKAKVINGSGSKRDNNGSG